MTSYVQVRKEVVLDAISHWLKASAPSNSTAELDLYARLEAKQAKKKHK